MTSPRTARAGGTPGCAGAVPWHSARSRSARSTPRSTLPVSPAGCPTGRPWADGADGCASGRNTRVRRRGALLFRPLALRGARPAPPALPAVGRSEGLVGLVGASGRNTRDQRHGALVSRPLALRGTVRPSVGWRGWRVRERAEHQGSEARCPGVSPARAPRGAFVRALAFRPLAEGRAARARRARQVRGRTGGPPPARRTCDGPPVGRAGTPETDVRSCWAPPVRRAAPCSAGSLRPSAAAPRPHRSGSCDGTGRSARPTVRRPSRCAGCRRGSARHPPGRPWCPR